MYRLCVFLIILTISFKAISQIYPKEGSRLNYRIVGISFPADKNAEKYHVEIAEGNYLLEDAFKKHIIQTITPEENKTIIEVPAFNKTYTWRVLYSGKSIGTKKSELHHFSTVMNAHADTSLFRLRVLQPAASQYRDHYVAVDNPGVMYDMDGHPIWYVPDTNGYGGTVADLQFTHDGTITFLYKNAFEINYDGTVIWKASNNGAVSGDATNGEFFHHEFTKLSNRYYIVMGMRPVFCKPYVSADTSYIIVANEEDKKNAYVGFARGRFGTLIEYDQQGNIVWSWLSFDHLKGTDFDYFNPESSLYRFDPHDNSFFFDEKNSVIYFGFRNLNRVIVIDYPSGKVIRTYGHLFKPGLPSVGDGMFCNQHSVGRSLDGYLYYYNNNSCGIGDSLPTVEIVKEPVAPTDDFKKIWEYTCTVEGDYPRKFGSGGNIVELSDRSLFVNMGTGYSKTFIVNRQKQVLWAALPERFMLTDKKWTPLHEYRCNIISRKDLERLIWRAEADAMNDH